MPRGKKTGPRAGTPSDKEIGLRLRAMRIEQGVSQGELGVVLGVSFQQIQKYEKGVNRISASRLMEVAKALKTSPLEIMGWDGAKIGPKIFDREAYRLAMSFGGLPDAVKLHMRALINSVIASTK